MNQHQDQLSKYPSVEDFGRDFMRAAQSQSSSPRRSVLRRLRVPLAGLAIAIGSGTLAYAVVNDKVVDYGDQETISVASGDTLGYFDLRSGNTLHCADGEPLTHSVGERDFRPPGFTDPTGAFGDAPAVAVVNVKVNELHVSSFGEPVCSDGAVPAEFNQLLYSGDLGVVVVDRK